MAAEQKVFLDREARKQPAAFRHHGNAEPYHFVRRLVADRLAVEHHHVGRGRQRAGNRAQERGLAGAVGADDGDGLALLDSDVDIEQRLEVAVERRKVVGR